MRHSPLVPPILRRPWVLAAGVITVIFMVAALALSPFRRFRAREQPPAEPAAAATFVFARRTITAAERVDYAGSAACAPCHHGEARQQTTLHARTLARLTSNRGAEPFRRHDEIVDPVLGVIYRPAVRGGRCLLEASKGSRSVEAPADYVFGSGAVATSYVAHRNGAAIELRLTYYGWAHQWDYTPGLSIGSKLDTALGHTLGPAEEHGCFECHATALVREDGVLDLDHSLLGVGCEACHGPGRQHIASARQGRPHEGMARLADHRDRVSAELCGQCHRTQPPAAMPASAVQEQLPRLEGYALSLSACFQRGHVTCVTCHDPHRNRADTSRAAYNTTCRSCHDPKDEVLGPRSGPSTSSFQDSTLHVVCKRAPRGDCVSCHMPAQDVGMPTHPRFRTHWIKVWRKDAPAGASGPRRETPGPTAD